MSEEKCDHWVGYAKSLYFDHYVFVNGESNEKERYDFDIQFKFCPLCGVEIEGDLTSEGVGGKI